MNVRELIPFERIARCKNVVGPRRTLKQVEALYPDADYIINTAIFDMSSGEILGRVNSAGRHYGRSIDAYGLDLTTVPHVTWGSGSEYVGPYSYAVKDGKTADGLRDKARRGRTALGVTKSSLALICVSDGDPAACSTETLCKTLLAMGCTHAINLDGGGSSQGRTPVQRFQSERPVPCWLCIWLKYDKKEEPEMLLKAAKRTQTYTAQGTPEANRYIGAGDSCEFSQELVKVKYPITGGTREAYVRLADLGNFTRA